MTEFILRRLFPKMAESADTLQGYLDIAEIAADPEGPQRPNSALDQG